MPEVPDNVPIYISSDFDAVDDDGAAGAEAQARISTSREALLEDRSAATWQPYLPPQTSQTSASASESSAMLADSDAEIAAQLIPVLENCYKGISGLQTGKMARFHWASSPLAKASYACFAPGQYTSIEGAQREPSGRIYFAGEHCSFEFQGFMNGAAQTGREAAEAILQTLD